MKYNIEKSKKLINAMIGHKYEFIYKIAIIYGISRFEMLNLTWQDIDFESNTISFSPVKYIKDNNYNYQWIKENKLEFKRTYPLIPNIKDLLLEKYNKTGSLSEFVCVNSRGEQLTANTIGRNLQQVIERNELELTLYDGLKDSINELLLNKCLNSNNYQAWKRFDILVRKQNIYESLNLTLNKKLVKELNKFLTQEKYIFKEQIEM